MELEILYSFTYKYDGENLINRTEKIICMINFIFLDIKRAIMHRILGKTNTQEYSSCEYSEELLGKDEETERILKERLVSAFGINSKSCNYSAPHSLSLSIGLVNNS